MEFYDFFPGLSKSNEVYFGRQAPLPQILIKYSEKFIEYFNNKDFIKSKSFYIDINKLTEKFGNELAKELNAETCKIIINPEKEPNAGAWMLTLFGDTCYTYKDDYGDKYIGVDFDKIADLEDIVVGQHGYTFRNSKNKILFITINYGLFRCELNAEEIAGIIAHEIGHCFQQGIFGVYKNVADICISQIVTDKRLAFRRDILVYLPIPGVLKAFLIHIFKLIEIESPLFAKLGAWFEKNFWSKLGSNTTYKMKEKLKQWDKGTKEGKEIEKDLNQPMGPFRTVGHFIMSLSKQYNKNYSRKDFIEDYEKENSKQWKKAKEENESPIKKKFRLGILDFFISIYQDISILDNNIFDVLSLSDYVGNQYAKISFYKRYEFFADIFATSYGFGPDLFKALSKMRKQVNDEIDNDLCIGLNKLPMFKAFFKTQLMKRIDRSNKFDSHGEKHERSVNTYTALVEELKTNPQLTSDQKKAIQRDIDILIDADEKFYEESKETGFWFKYYNKLIDRRIKGETSKATIKEVLEPIKEVCNEK